MPKHIYEHAGVMLDVTYAIDPDGRPNFTGVRVMDGDYRPCGPDLRSLLHQTCIIHGTPVMGRPMEASTLLSIIAEELI